MESFVVPMAVVATACAVVLALKARRGVALVAVLAGIAAMAVGAAPDAWMGWLLPLFGVVLACALVTMFFSGLPGSWWFRTVYAEDKQNGVRLERRTVHLNLEMREAEAGGGHIRERTYRGSR